MVDIKDVKEAVAFPLTLAVAVEEMMANGFQWTDVFFSHSTFHEIA